MRPEGTVFYQFYRGISALAAPLIWRRVSAKLARDGVRAPDSQLAPQPNCPWLDTVVRNE